ncbi:hypothetical protein A33M_3937 [Rhodovulum sp. PH10]|uniref:hypothetical protein n=1 Tax=Rhodovulum sp. PH10 TaxID=1187851 RepID=UPI00027C2210|nr:hypothetical protein [Rhodovulum sp. PH10]EJW10868.1 hypothetical protein A33M_3937 [Rhodovulum sp. PH10]
MPLRFDGPTVRFEGLCMVEEALGLVEHWRETPPGTVDLSTCTHVHTALLQVLAAAAPAEVIPPSDPTLARFVAPILASRRPLP